MRGSYASQRCRLLAGFRDLRRHVRVGSTAGRTRLPSRRRQHHSTGRDGDGQRRQPGHAHDAWAVPDTVNTNVAATIDVSESRRQVAWATINSFASASNPIRPFGRIPGVRQFPYRCGFPGRHRPSRLAEPIAMEPPTPAGAPISDLTPTSVGKVRISCLSNWEGPSPFMRGPPQVRPQQGCRFNLDHADMAGMAGFNPGVRLLSRPFY